MRRLDIIIPANNEAENLPVLVSRLDRALKSARISYRLVIVDDYSTDSTAAVAKKLSKRYPIILHKKVGPQGKAFAILEAVPLTSTPFIGLIDADLQYPPEAVPDLFKLIPGSGVVIANRQTHQTSLLRRLVSRFQKHLTSRVVLGGSYDVQSGLKIFSRDIIPHLPRNLITPWTFDLPLLRTALNLGYSIDQVDITFSPRRSGRSKIRFFSATWQIASIAVKTYLGTPRIFPLLSPNASPIGSGVMFHGRKFITHTRLPLHSSAATTLVAWQKLALVVLGLTLVAGAAYSLKFTAVIFVGVLTIIYFLDVIFNLFLVLKSLNFPPELSFTPAELAALPSRSLPVYSILCPLYREATVLPQFVQSILSLDWPKSRLDVLLLLEANDLETIAVARRMATHKHIRYLIVPDSHPKTKPKACNYGLAHTRGEYVVVFDAEDKPDPQQLKKAYLAFQKVAPEVVCLQAKLNYYNPRHNLLTRLFTAEYSLWFDVILPGLQSINTTIPLGGTSNHFRTATLKALHGWDAFNVTEDCDLGTRLFQHGFRTAMIDSTTLEEANSKLGNWFRQRSRWIKGYIQTFFVHNRHPLRFLKTHGWHALIFQLIVGGKIAFMLINPLLWLATLAYFTLYAWVGPAIESLYPPVIFYLAVFSLVFGNFLFLYYYMIGAIKKGHYELVKYIYLVPVYWLMVSISAVKAVLQLITRPHYWEKTHHGFHLKSASPRFVWPQLAIPKFSLPQLALPKLTRPNLALPKLSRSQLAGGVLVAATVFSSFLNFVFNAYLGRHLEVAEFGLIGLIGSLLYVVQIPLFALSRTVTFRVAYILGKHKLILKPFWSSVRSKTISISLAVTSLWLISTPSLSHFFQAPDLLPFLLFTPLWLVGFVNAVDVGFLTGVQKFTALGIAMLLEATLKLGLAVFFVHFSPDLVYAALPLSAVVAFIFLWLVARSQPAPKSKMAEKLAAHFPFSFFGSSVISSISALIFLSLDVVLAKHFLDPDTAGNYALLSLVGKMVFFGGTIFSQFVTPFVSRNLGLGKSPRPAFYWLLLGSVITSLAGFFTFGVFGAHVVPWLLGPRSQIITPYLFFFTAAMASFAVSSLLISYHQAKKQYYFPAVSLFFVCLQVGLIFLRHSDITDFTTISLFVSGTYLATVVLLHIYIEFIGSLGRFLQDLTGLFTRPHPKLLLEGNNLRILIFNWRDIRHLWAGGAEVYIHQLAKNWVKAGHQVTIFAGNDRLGSKREVIDGVEIIRKGGFFTVYIWAVLYYLFKFRGHYDLVVDCENGIPFFTPLFVSVPKFLLIHHVHQNVFRQHLPVGLSLIASALESRLMPVVYKSLPIITVSSSSQAEIAKLCHRPVSDIAVVNPGIDPDIFTPSASKTLHPSFLYLGRLQAYKNIDIAIQAFARIQARYPAARFHIAGRGEASTALKSLVARMQLGKSVVFHDFVSQSQKVKLLSQCWVMLQPSSFEGWGITVIEANACGTPVIASKVCGLIDSVHDGSTGILVTAKDIPAWVAAMDSLLASRKDLRRMSKAALAWSANFSWTDNSRRFLLVLRQHLADRFGYSLISRPAYLPTKT